MKITFHLILFMSLLRCITDHEKDPIGNTDYPKVVKEYNDGCNTCKKYDDGTTTCTMKFCAPKGE